MHPYLIVTKDINKNTWMNWARSQQLKDCKVCNCTLNDGPHHNGTNGKGIPCSLDYCEAWKNFINSM